MTWLKLSDDWANRPDILALSDGAFRLHVAAMSHCMRHLTDRLVARHVVPMLTPTHRPRLVTELVDAGLWAVQGDAWYVADAVMDEQPTRAEVDAQKAVDAARVELGRARKADDPERLSRAVERDREVRAALARIKAERRTGHTEHPADVTPNTTPHVTPNVHTNVTPNVRLPRPDPTRPGASTTLSGAGGADATAPSADPPRSFAERGLPRPPGHPGPAGLRRAADEELLDDCRRILTDPDSPAWLRSDAENRLVGLGVTPEALLARNGRGAV